MSAATGHGPGQKSTMLQGVYPAQSTRPPTRLTRWFPAFGEEHFPLFWLSTLGGPLAYQMGVVAVGYAAFQLTGAATPLGLVSLAIGLPMMVFSLVGGVIADRAPRRLVMMLCQGLLAVCAVALAWLTSSGTLELWHLLVISVVQGTAFSFNLPARQAYLADLVGPYYLRNAAALHNAGMNFTRIAGPALAGGVISLPILGLGGVFACMAVLYSSVVATYFRLPEQRPSPPAGEQERPSGWVLFREGMDYIRSSPTLRTLLFAGLVLTLLGMPFQTLMPVFADEVYGVGAAGLGIMMAAIGAGALAGAVLVAALSLRGRLGLLQLWMGVLFGASLVGFGLAPAYWVAVLMLLMVGFSSAAYSSLNNTLAMGNTDERLMGRVMSSYQLLFAMMPLGTLPAAWLADRIGGPATVTVTGILVTVAVAAIALRFPAFRRIS